MKKDRVEPDGPYPPGLLFPRGLTISRILLNRDAASPRMMIGNSVGGRNGEIPRF